MNLRTVTSIAALGLLAVATGCATTATDSVAMYRTHNQAVVTGQSSTSRANVIAVAEVSPREPALSGRGERGIPMPEPAREPVARAAPQPQIPIPVAPQDRGGAMSTPAAFGAYVY
jgi:hypothetical protein